jgi:glycosyltransferase involved in cell wall biosynthesis
MIARAERLAAKHAALTIAVSDADRDALRTLAPAARVEVVPNSVDLRTLTPLPVRRADNDPVLLFVGSYDYPPNQEAAVEIVEEHLPVLRQSWPRLQVRLVGRDRSGVVERCAQRAPGAVFRGFAGDLAAEYEVAHAVYVPLRSGGGTRIKILEAFAVCRPVIATALAVEGLGARAGVHYLPCETPEEGAASLRRVLDGGAQPIIAAARRLVEEHHGHPAAESRLAELFAAVGAGAGAQPVR